MNISIPKSTLLYDINYELFCNRGAKSTDYVILKGNYVSDMGYSYHWISEIEEECGYDDISQLVFPDDGLSYYASDDCGVRPTIDYDFLINNGVLIEENKKYLSREYLDQKYNGERAYSLYQYGEYPQTKLNEEDSKFMEAMYLQGNMYKTGNYYSYSSSNVDYDKDEEFEYEGKRYVRAKIYDKSYWFKQKNKKFIVDNEYIWVRVEPIIWFVDIKCKLCVSKNIIVGPTQYNDVAKDNITGTYIEKYLNDYFSKEITGQYRVDISDIKNENKLHDWLNWSNENLIHPVIHMFMIEYGKKYLCKDIDWISISNELYNCSDLSCLYGNEIYEELNNLYQSINISIFDVLSGNVDKNVLDNLSNVKKYLLITLLTTIDKDNYDLVYSFIESNIGKKYARYYDELFNQCISYKDGKNIK